MSGHCYVEKNVIENAAILTGARKKISAIDVVSGELGVGARDIGDIHAVDKELQIGTQSWLERGGTSSGGMCMVIRLSIR